MRGRRSAIVVSLVAAATVVACAQIQGLDGYEKVDCLDNCTEMPDSTVVTDDATVADTFVPPPIDAAVDTGIDAPIDTGVDAGNCATGCNPGFDCCSNTCVDLNTDEANCGVCGTPCGGGLTCCGKTCFNAQTNTTHCGTCGNGCAVTETCAGGGCSLVLVGDGVDGAFAPVVDTTINDVAAGVTTAAANQKDVTVTSVSGFAANQLVFIHQTRGNGAGVYEHATIASVDAANSKLVMVHSLSRAYSSAGDDRAQVVRVPRFSTVTIPAGVTVTAPAWDGTKGGIVIYKASGAVAIDGVIDMSARGFRGSSHAASCAAGTRYACDGNANTANGFSGESASGPSANANGANGGGGGGGQDGQDCAGGGGGAYGAAGGAGVNGGGLFCRNGAQLGGAAGGVSGSSDLRTAVLLGGAGGEGGGDEDGAYPGAGGNGGGIVFIDATFVAVTGAVRVNGAIGFNGVQSDAVCGGAGCGMGGGGGAGGAVRIRVGGNGNASLGTGLVTALGAVGGACSCDLALANGGASGAGRIGVAGTVTGSTSPTHDSN